MYEITPAMVAAAAADDPGEAGEIAAVKAAPRRHLDGHKLTGPEYEGWTNRATWCAALWLGNDEPLYRATLDRLEKARNPRDRAWKIRSAFRLYAPDMARSEVRRAGGVSKVDWCEIADDAFPEA